MAWTNDANLLMVCSQPPQLDIYAPDAERLTSIPLPSDMTNPLHAVELVTKSPSVTQYVVTHGRDSNEMHRVFIVSSSLHLSIAFASTRRQLDSDDFSRYSSCVRSCVDYRVSTAD
jgi:hypothetical protein